MTEQHPITPPSELLDQWLAEWASNDEVTGPQVEYVATEAARWGADQELEACCKWLGLQPAIETLRAARRPKPLSLKEQALAELAGAVASGNITSRRWALIRRALEQLDD